MRGGGGTDWVNAEEVVVVTECNGVCVCVCVCVYITVGIYMCVQAEHEQRSDAIFMICMGLKQNKKTANKT